MQYSKADRVQSEGQLLNKIEKLRQEVLTAEDYIKLEKTAKKLSKIMSSASLHPDRKVRKQIKAMGEVCQGLIIEKTRFFKKKIIQKISGKTEEKSNSQDKTLKYSKSVENFQGITSKAQKSKRVIPKIDDQQLWAQKTQIQRKNPFHLQEVVEQLRDELETYKRQLMLMERPNHNLSLKLGEQHIIFDNELNLKLKEKGHQIEQLKGRLKYHEQTNQQLRNRLSNEQKRQEDYIFTLKSHISSLNQEVQTLNLQIRKLRQQLISETTNNNKLQIELKRIMDQTNFLNREKRQRQQSQVMKMKDSGTRKQLLAMSQQQKYIRQIEHLLQSQRQEKIVIIQQRDSLKKRQRGFQDQIVALQNENEKLLNMIELQKEENQSLKTQMTLTIEALKRRTKQLEDCRNQINLTEQEKQKQKLQKALELKKKAQHLKQIKQMLQGR